MSLATTVKRAALEIELHDAIQNVLEKHDLDKVKVDLPEWTILDTVIHWHEEYVRIQKEVDNSMYGKMLRMRGE